jgi:hypothetical protein
LARDCAFVEPGQRDRRRGVIFDLPSFGLGADHLCLPGLDAIKGVVRRDAMGFGLRIMGLALLRHPFHKRQRLFSQLPVLEVFIALFLGKLLKYSVYGFLAARFPSWFQHFRYHKQT